MIKYTYASYRDQSLNIFTLIQLHKWELFQDVWRYFCLREVKDYGIPKVIVVSVVLSNLLPEEQWPVYPKDRR